MKKMSDESKHYHKTNIRCECKYPKRIQSDNCNRFCYLLYYQDKYIATPEEGYQYIDRISDSTNTLHHVPFHWFKRIARNKLSRYGG